MLSRIQRRHSLNQLDVSLRAVDQLVIGRQSDGGAIAAAQVLQ